MRLQLQSSYNRKLHLSKVHLSPLFINNQVFVVFSPRSICHCPNHLGTDLEHQYSRPQYPLGLPRGRYNYLYSSCSFLAIFKTDYNSISTHTEKYYTNLITKISKENMSDFSDFLQLNFFLQLNVYVNHKVLQIQRRRK